jgi:electron transfer flavoprotein beta subunit
MKILVCISHVPDTTSKINFVDDDTVFDKNGVKFVINPNDEFGLTRAVWFQQKQQAEVTVVTVGDPSCEPTLRKCLAIGADKAVRIDLNPTDGFQVAQQLSAHCKVENYDLIIAGRESIDYNGAMVPGMVSALLGYNFVTNCIALEIDGNSVKASREIDEGIESVSCQLPVVIGAQKGLVEEKDLIIPNMRGIIQARQKSLSVIPPVEGEIRSSITKFEKPAPKEAVKMVDADQIDQLIDLLHNEAKVI